MPFSERLKEIRLSKGLSQKRLAEAIGMTEIGYRRYELGMREPAFQYLIALAEFYDVNLDYLVGRSDKSEPPERRIHIMQMIPVSSSDISSVGYENGTLHIRFNSGGLYAYYDVPENVYRGLLTAASAGKFFHASIKDHYSTQKIA